MCVVNKQFELLEFVFDSVYVDLKYDEISLLSLLLLGMCHCVVSELVECVRCVCFWLGTAWEDRGEWMRRLGLDFTNPGGTGGVLDVCLWCGWCRWGGVGGVV